MNRQEDRIAATVGIILLMLIFCAICYVMGYKAAKAAEIPNVIKGNVSSLTRPVTQTWSEIELVMKAVEERKAAEALAQEALNKQAEEAAKSRPVESAPSGGSYEGEWQGSPGVEQWRSLVEASSWCGWNVDRMLYIMDGESGGDPTNHPDGSLEYVGLFQLYNGDNAYPYETWSDGAWNIQAAAEAFAAHGYAPWKATDRGF